MSEKKSQTTANFERVIRDYLDEYAELDTAFAAKYKNEKKSIEECCKYIMGEAKKACTGGSLALTDDEVYGMAVHYYDEDSIIINPASAQVVSNHFAELTDEDKAEARAQALKEYEAECKAALAKEEQERRRKEDERRKKAAEERAAREEAWNSRQISIFDEL